MKELDRSLVVLGLVGVTACTSSVADDHDSPAPPPRALDIGPLSGGGVVPAAPAPELFDSKGRRWAFKRQFPAWAKGQPKLDRSGTGSYVAASLSDDELAEALRPARLHGNAEYVLDIPHSDLLARVQSARAKRAAGEIYDHPGPLDVARTIGVASEAVTDVPVANAGLLLPPAVSQARRWGADSGGWRPDRLLDERRDDVLAGFATSPTVDAPMSPQDVLGGEDTRSFVTHAGVASWPLPATIAMGSWVSGAGVLNDSQCSANLIGIYTAVSAAHCFWDFNAPYPYSHWPIANGVVTSGTRSGGGVWLITQQTRMRNATECYDRYYPSGWTMYWSWDFDMGVIEFGCLPFPGLNGNHLRSGYQTDAVYRTKPLYLEAYDHILLDQDPSNDYGPFADPSLRTRYDGDPNAVYIPALDQAFLETTRVDVTRAASGGCIRQQLHNSNVPYNWYCSAVVSHGTSTKTLFRRLDYDFMVFIQSFSEY